MSVCQSAEKMDLKLAVQMVALMVEKMVEQWAGMLGRLKAEQWADAMAVLLVACLVAPKAEHLAVTMVVR